MDSDESLCSESEFHYPDLDEADKENVNYKILPSCTMDSCGKVHL